MKSTAEQLLHDRARLLAQPSPEAPDPESLLEVLEFTLGQGTYCLETAFLVDVHTLTEVTRLPGTPDFVLGLVGIRGRILCVLDLKRWLGLPMQGLGDHPKVILMKSGTLEFGVLVDFVGGIYKVLRNQIFPLPPSLSGLGSLANGLFENHGILLNAAAMLTDPHITVYQGDF